MKGLRLKESKPLVCRNAGAQQAVRGKSMMHDVRQFMVRHDGRYNACVQALLSRARLFMSGRRHTTSSAVEHNPDIVKCPTHVARAQVGVPQLLAQVYHKCAWGWRRRTRASTS